VRELSLILKPLSWLYGLILRVRHYSYDRGFFFSKTFDQPIIKIGNLSLGGSGKTPMTVYLAKSLSRENNVYILSRGYGRQTKGFHEVLDTSHYLDVGDEPLMMKLKLPNVKIFVSEDRVHGIESINQLDSQKKVILLDDSLQHRRLRGGYSILLTDYNQPFFKDELLPLGKLRDVISRARIVDMVVVTKAEISERSNMDFVLNLEQFTTTKAYFSGIHYLPYKNLITGYEVTLKHQVMAITAIANPSLFYDKIRLSANLFHSIEYKDHYKFREFDVKEWLKLCNSNQIQQIIVTEKDAVKLKDFKDLFLKNEIELVILPIEPYFEPNKEIEILNKIDLYINQYS